MKESKVLRSTSRLDNKPLYLVSANKDKTIDVTHDIDEAKNFKSFWKLIFYSVRFNISGFYLVKW